MRLDVVLPVYNEEEALPPFIADLRGVLDTLDLDWLVHLVVDESTDETETVVTGLCSREQRFRALLLSSRFGHQEALLAGLSAARRDAHVLMMDADGQHPPALIPELIVALDNGVDVVLTRRLSTARQSLPTRLLSAAFYRVLSALSGVSLQSGMADFRVLTPTVASVLRDGFKERSPFIRGLIGWMGFRRKVIEYRATPRIGGRTKYTLRRRFRFAREAILAFSLAPLRIAAPLGFLIAACSLFYGLYLAGSWAFGDPDLPRGWTTIVTAITFLGGVQLAFIGILGEYLGRVYGEVKGRPRFVVRRALNYEDGSYRRFG